MEVCLEQMKNVIKCKDGKGDSNGNSSENGSGDVKKDEKEIQLDYYYKIKKMLPLLDRTGRLMTDLSVYANECVKPSNLKDLNRGLYKSNNKMESQTKESDVNTNDNNNNNNVQGANFQKQLEDITHTNNTNNNNENKNDNNNDSILNDMLKGYTDDSIKNTTLEFLNTLPSRERRSTRYLPARNKFDELFKNQIPLNDLPAFINHYHSVLSRPLYDIYVHEIPQSTYEALNALSNNRTNETNTNTATTTTTNNESPNQFFRDSSTEQQQQQNTTPNIQNETNNECPVGISGQNVNDTNTVSNNIESNNETTINTNELDDIIVENANTNNTNNNTNEQSDNIDKDK
jgi:hypothetical protein